MIFPGGASYARPILAGRGLWDSCNSSLRIFILSPWAIFPPAL